MSLGLKWATGAINVKSWNRTSCTNVIPAQHWRDQFIWHLSYLPVTTVLSQRFSSGLICSLRGHKNLLSVEIFHWLCTGWCFFIASVSRHDGFVIIPNAEPTTIECLVMIFAKWNAVIKPIIAELRERLDVCIIYYVLTILADNF